MVLRRRRQESCSAAGRCLPNDDDSEKVRGALGDGNRQVRCHRQLPGDRIQMLKNTRENMRLVVLPAVATALTCFRWLDVGIAPACDRIPDIHNVL